MEAQGGYNLEAISRSALAVAHVLLGDSPPELGRLEATEIGTEVIYQVAKVQSKYWKNIDLQACEPPPGVSLPASIFHRVVLTDKHSNG